MNHTIIKQFYLAFLPAMFFYFFFPDYQLLKSRQFSAMEKKYLINWTSGFMASKNNTKEGASSNALAQKLFFSFKLNGLGKFTTACKAGQQILAHILLRAQLPFFDVVFLHQLELTG
jgi:hypothetical protein